jgi:hypothetical protein
VSAMASDNALCRTKSALLVTSRLCLRGSKFQCCMHSHSRGHYIQVDVSNHSVSPLQIRSSKGSDDRASDYRDATVTVTNAYNICAQPPRLRYHEPELNRAWKSSFGVMRRVCIHSACIPHVALGELAMCRISGVLRFGLGYMQGAAPWERRHGGFANGLQFRGLHW